ncbi:hypothetical protein CFP65_3840 [Kitasatospora sp. MMS16-BH015]|uniref:hypothetical protein n=1 Tax=Kitasatospora sp. MMS16-BH015 TaxID=2018025 RepID=UPI000CA1B9B7|nr:hypothetical protein [Kitasatospora sp. MMS16-BH015]AUG78620.1 hypothetical protein CFP65_3840 [Kitasatospora sp. MMS16-BH015]
MVPGTTFAPSQAPDGAKVPPDQRFFQPPAIRGIAINTRRTAAVAAAVVLGTLSLPVTTAVASATLTDLYVDRAAAHCSDTGQGTAIQPYCTIGAAADTVQPGQTVHIAPGDYPEQVTLTRSGTAGAPITFTGAGAAIDLQRTSSPPSGVQTTVLGKPASGGAKPALTIAGASHVRFQDMQLAGASGTVTIEGGSDIRLSRDQFVGTGGSGAAIEVGGAAQGVTISQTESRVTPFVHVAPGARDTVLSTNAVPNADSRSGPVISVDSAPGTVIVGNTLTQGCAEVIAVMGATTGATIENNVIQPFLCSNRPQSGQVSVTAAAASGTKAAYNVYPTGGGPIYQWAGTAYSSLAEFAAATGQGAHDLVADTPFVPWYGATDRPSPIFDSADENAPGMTDTDITGEPAVDDPWVPDTGTGSGHRDRGAYEVANFATRYTPTGPTRILDTRNGTGVDKATAVPPHGTIDLQVAGLGGLPATGISAVTMNVTATGAACPGYLTVYPHGEDRPLASSVNWTAGQTVPNLVTAKVIDGKLSFYNGSNSTVHVVADLLGSYRLDGSGYHATAPSRLLDTRDGTGAAKAPLINGKPIDLQVTGRGGVPATGVTAVTLNVTATGATDRGYLTAYPHGTDRPTASNLNWTAGQTVPNLVTVPVKDGKVSLVAGGTNGTVDVVADVSGYFTVTGGDSYHALTPTRIRDTRVDPWIPADQGPWHAGPIAPRRAPVFTAKTRDTAATAVSLNVTVTGGTAPGYLTVYPSNPDNLRPLASNLNWTTGQTVANQVVVGLGGRDDDYYNGSQGTVHVVTDLNGYYAP